MPWLQKETVIENDQLQFGEALRDTVWPPPTSRLADNIFPMSVPDTVPPEKQGDPPNETDPVKVVPD
jgi:hypothetical protein